MILFISFLIAPFLIWREEHYLSKGLSENVNKKDMQIESLTNQIKSNAVSESLKISTKRLNILTDQELHDNAKIFLGELRKIIAEQDVLEEKYRFSEWAQQSNAITGKDPNDAVVKEQMQKIWEDNSKKENDRHNLADANFNTRFRSPLIEYSDEICKRLQFTKPCDQTSPATHMLLSGQMIGPFFGEIIVDYLDRKVNDLE